MIEKFGASGAAAVDGGATPVVVPLRGYGRRPAMTLIFLLVCITLKPWTFTGMTRTFPLPCSDRASSSVDSDVIGRLVGATWLCRDGPLSPRDGNVLAIRVDARSTAAGDVDVLLCLCPHRPHVNIGATGWPQPHDCANSNRSVVCDRRRSSDALADDDPRRSFDVVDGEREVQLRAREEWSSLRATLSRSRLRRA